MSERKGSGRQRIISIRWIVCGAAIALTSVSVLLVAGIGERRTREALTRELETRLILEARDLAVTSTRALLSEFPELTLQPILADMKSDVAGFVFAAVVDHENVIRAHPDARSLGKVFHLPEGFHPEQTDASLHDLESLMADDTTLLSTAPVRHPGGEPIGTAVVAVSRDTIDAAIHGARRNQLLLLAGLLAAGILSSFALMSILLRPLGSLREGLERIGRGDLATPVSLKDRTEFGLLASTMNEMAARIRAAQAEMLEKERLTHELELAREIQSSLLPAAGMHVGEYTIEGFHRDAAEVGGDFYDIFPLPDGQVGLAIADVSGKGLAGCLVAAMLSALLGAFRGEGGSPRSTILLLEKYLVRTLRPGTFVTMFYGALDPATGQLTFVSAGHNPFLLVRARTGATEIVKTKGIPLGAIRGGAFSNALEEKTITLEPGDVVVQFTDGVSEAFDPSNTEQFGIERLRKAAEKKALQGSPAVIDAIREGLRRWTKDSAPFDDETLVVLSRSAANAGASSDVAAPSAAAPSAADLFASAAAGNSSTAELIALSRRTGQPIQIPAKLEALSGLKEWISTCRDLRELSLSERTVLESALYEVCANVIEHGYGEDSTQKLEMSWLAADSSESTSSDVAGRVREGLFVLIDRAAPFAPGFQRDVNLKDPAVRKRGRGLGLEIIRGAMEEITVLPETSEGNVTVLRFDPAKVRVEEVRHVS